MSDRPLDPPILLTVNSSTPLSHKAAYLSLNTFLTTQHASHRTPLSTTQSTQLDRLKDQLGVLSGCIARDVVEGAEKERRRKEKEERKKLRRERREERERVEMEEKEKALLEQLEEEEEDEEEVVEDTGDTKSVGVKTEKESDSESGSGSDSDSDSEAEAGESEDVKMD